MYAKRSDYDTLTFIGALSKVVEFYKVECYIANRNNKFAKHWKLRSIFVNLQGIYKNPVTYGYHYS